MGVHISRIEIRNFRNFRHLTIDPFPSRAVIVGENGAGKTNLLEALRIVLDPTLPDSARQLREDDIWEGSSRNLSQGIEVLIKVDFQGYDDDEDAKAVLSTATVAASPYTARLTYRYRPRVEVMPGWDGEDVALLEVDRPLTPQDYEFTIFGGASEGSTDIRRFRRDVALRVLKALRDAESDLRNWRRNPLRELLERLPLDPVNLEATATAMAAAVAQLTQDANVLALEGHIASRLQAMVGPRLPVTPTLGFASSQPDELVRAVQLFVDSARKHGMGGTSLGSANVVYLGLLLEALAQQRVADLFVASILAVEEPEAHLHVNLQRTLFRYLLRTEPALLLTTHSPHIAAVAPVDSLVLLRTTSKGTVGRSTADLAVTPAQAEDLERYLDVSRAEVLFASLIILVEGLAETYVVPAIARAAGFDLDAYGVVVASVHGTDFAPFRTLLGPDALDIPHVVVTDGDASGDTAGRREAGLRRGIRLHAPPGPGRNALTQRLKELVGGRVPDYSAERGDLANTIRASFIFVGRQTLEVDVTSLFPDEVNAAFTEVSAVQSAKDDVAGGVLNESAANPDTDVRATMLGRIGAVGKGRFAQRFAAHIERVDLRERVADALGIAADELDDDVEFSGVGPAEYLLEALDAISRTTRGFSLFGAPPPVQPARNRTEG